METIKINTSQNIDINYEMAGLGERIVGRIIDYAIFVVLYFIGVICAVALSAIDHTFFYVAIIIYAVAFVFYDLVCEITMNGQSFGKKIMKIRVISLTGGQPTLAQYLLRWLFRIVDFILTGQAVGLIMVAVTEKKQRLGDLVAETIVIKTKPRTVLNHIAFKPQEEAYEPVFNDVIHLNDREIELIYEVLSSFHTTGNAELIYAMAEKIKQRLGVTPPQGMNEFVFLQTIIEDYNHLTSRMSF